MQILPILGLAWSSALGAEPLFVPSFTPNTPNEAVLASKLEREVISRLREDGHIVIEAEIAASVVGPTAVERCAVLPTCPSVVLPQLPARFSVVGRIDKLSDGTILGHVEYYRTAESAAWRVTDSSVAPGNEAAFANEVARNTNELIDLTGPSSDAMRAEARELIAGGLPQPMPKPAPAASAVVPEPAADPLLPAPSPTPPAPEPATPEVTAAPTEPPRVAGPRGDGSTPHTASIRELIEGTSVKRRYLVGAERHFKKSGLDPRDYMYVATPHAGRVTIEVRAGFGSGDINRQARLRAEVVDGDQQRSWYREGPDQGQSFRGEFVLGYAPVTLFDIGALVGLQYGERTVNTGIYTPIEATGQVERRSNADTSLALNVYLQPRLRLFLVPFGPAKPFVVGGAEFRFIDGYAIAGNGVDFLTPEPGIVPGAFGGAGMMIDAGPIVGLFAEATYTQHFGPRASATQASGVGGWPYDESPFDATQTSTVAINGGVQFRL